MNVLVPRASSLTGIEEASWKKVFMSSKDEIFSSKKSPAYRSVTVSISEFPVPSKLRGNSILPSERFTPSPKNNIVLAIPASFVSSMGPCCFSKPASGISALPFELMLAKPRSSIPIFVSMNLSSTIQNSFSPTLSMISFSESPPLESGLKLKEVEVLL